MRRPLWSALLGLWVVAACNGEGQPWWVPTSDERNPEGDADTDVDTDDDTGDPTSDLDCSNTPYDTPAPGSNGQDACVTGEIRCGKTVYASNEGGSSFFGTDQGEQFAMCSGSASGSDFAGPERVYNLQVAPTTLVTARLQSCEQSWLMIFQGSNGCPTEEPGACNYATTGTYEDQSETFLVGDVGSVWFVVEGFQNTGGNFALSVECE